MRSKASRAGRVEYMGPPLCSMGINDQSYAQGALPGKEYSQKVAANADGFQVAVGCCLRQTELVQGFVVEHDGAIGILGDHPIGGEVRVRGGQLGARVS